MSKLDERTEQGIALASEMLGDTFGQRIREHIDSGTFASDLARFGMTHSYTDCWSREGLDRRSRSLVTIGALVGMRQPNELKNHIKAGVANGLTVFISDSPAQSGIGKDLNATLCDKKG